MIHTRLLIAACVAALLGAAPLIAQDMQQPGMNNQGGQSDQTIYKKKKKMGQTQGQTQGQMTGTEQTQNQATGQETQPIKKKKLQQSTQGEQPTGQGQNQKKLKKPQQATGNQPMTGNQQATGGQAQPKKKKLIQQGQAQQGQNKQGQPSEQMTTGATGKLATEIPPEKRTVVREKLISTNVQRVERTKINVNLRVGVRVPRTIHFYPVPAEVVQLVPAYRGYLYFVLADGTIVIVSPQTYQVVYVLTA